MSALEPGADENLVVREVQVNSSLSFETTFLRCTVHPHHREVAGPGRGEYARFVDDRQACPTAYRCRHETKGDGGGDTKRQTQSLL